MSKVLITGGAGFIGYSLASRLVEHYTGTGQSLSLDLVDNLSRGAADAAVQKLAQQGNVRLLQADLLDPNALNLDTDYDYIYHLSAILGVQNVLRSPLPVLRDNVAMLFHVLQFAQRQKQLKSLFFASTSEVYAGTLEHYDLPIPTPETTPLALPGLGNPRTSYMLSKIYGEALCQHAGIPVTIMRPHNIYGPRMGMSHVIPELLRKAHFSPPGGSIEVFSVSHSRTFCYISDAVEMMRRATESPSCTGKTLNLGNQAPEITIGELAQMICQVVGKDLTIVPQPETPGSPRRRCPEMTQAISLTGYTPQVGLAEGVQRTYEWYATHVFV